MPEAEEGLQKLALEVNQYVTSHQLNNVGVIIPSGIHCLRSFYSHINRHRNQRLLFEQTHQSQHESDYSTLCWRCRLLKLRI